MKQDNKFWARNDEMLLADTKFESGPMDPFKTISAAKEKKNNVIEKINNINHFSPRNIVQ